MKADCSRKCTECKRSAHESVLGVGRMFTKYAECRKNVHENVLSVGRMFAIWRRRRHMS